MIWRRSFALLALFFFSGLSFLTAADTMDQFVRLLINEKDGSFSLYYLTDQSAMRYEPLFYDRSSSTSFLSVSVDGRVYHLGKSMAFRTRIERIDRNPAVIYESSFLIVSMIFTPVKTSSSPNANGVKISITIENKTNRDVSVGLRLLLDTHLGEGRGGVPFNTDNLVITRETIISGSSNENYWITRGQNISLMGSIKNILDDESKTPDFLHFANWKKLSDVPWRARYREGWPFNSIPYSIGDSAVCYYYEPDVLSGEGSFKYSIYLTTEDTAWYTWARTVIETPNTEKPTINIAAIEAAAILEAVGNNENAEMLTLLKLQGIIEQFIAGEIMLNEQDLLEIERSIERHRNRQ